MTKYSRLIKLLNYLYNRNYVTKEELCKECGVGERTIYRYFSSLSEANIPIYYDKRIGKYRINTPSKVFINRINNSEIILLYSLLNEFRDKYKDYYNNTVDQLKDTFESLFSSYSKQSIEKNESLPMGIPTNNLLLKIHILNLTNAKQNNKKVMIAYQINGSSSQSRVITSPILRFNKTWEIHDLDDTQSKTIPLQNVLEVKIL